MVAAIAIAAAAARRTTPRRRQAPPPIVAPTTADHGGVTGTEIVLGEPAGFTGPSAGLAIEQWRGLHVAFEERNAAGGVNGRQIHVVLADDGYDAERAASAVVKLIAQSHVFALFAGVGTPTIVKALPVVREYHDETGLFYFANFTGAQPQRNPPYFDAVFNVRASYQQETKAMVDAFLAAGKKRIGTFVQDDAYGIDGNEGVTKALAAANLTIAASARYQRGQTYDASNAAQVKILQRRQRRRDRHGRLVPGVRRDDPRRPRGRLDGADRQRVVRRRQPDARPAGRRGDVRRIAVRQADHHQP